MLRGIEIILSALYLISAVMYVKDFIRPTEFTRKTTGVMIWHCLLWHVLYFIVLGTTFGRNPVASFSEFLSALALGLLIIYLYLEIRFKTKSLGHWILSMIAVFQVISMAIIHHPSVEEIDEIFSSVWFSIHLILVPLAIASLLISAVFSFMYLILYRSLKQKKLGFFFDRFLPLAILGEANYQSLITGVVFLGLNIPISFAMVYSIEGRIVWDFHYCMVLTYFLTYVIGVLLGRFAGWRGNRLAIYSLGSLILLILATGAGKILSERHSWF